MTATPTDWRGTPITEGALVIYGAGVGRSIQLVEGTVDGFTASGRVRIRIVRRSYLSGTKPVVDVGPDRLTVVDALPPTDVPTQSEDAVIRAERSRRYYSHSMPDYFLDGPPWMNPGRVCRACGVGPQAAYDKECPA